MAQRCTVVPRLSHADRSSQSDAIDATCDPAGLYQVRKKNNTLGIGAENTDMDYNWLETQDTFNSLLKDLNSACAQRLRHV